MTSAGYQMMMADVEEFHEKTIDKNCVVAAPWHEVNCSLRNVAKERRMANGL